MVGTHSPRRRLRREPDPACRRASRSEIHPDVAIQVEELLGGGERNARWGAWEGGRKGRTPCAPLKRSPTSGVPPWTLCYDVYMSVNVSVRLDEALAERLRMRARAAGESLSDRLRRYAEEGARREEHPLIMFRDGPAGRRAGLLGGPDVWEIMMWLDDLATEPDPLATLVEDSILTRPQIDAALRYRAAYPDEIAARIELHRRETASAETF